MPAIHTLATKLPDRSGRARDLTAVRQQELTGLRHSDLKCLPHLRTVVHQDRTRLDQPSVNQIADLHASAAKQVLATSLGLIPRAAHTRPSWPPGSVTWRTLETYITT